MPLTLDQRRAREILDGLPTALAAELSTALEPSWKARNRRMEARDCAIRVAVASFYPGRRHTAALSFERDFGRVISGVTAGFSEAHLSALRQIADLNRGRSIGWRQVENILVGERTPTDFAIISGRNCKK
jgi:hypothetical protein